MIFLDTGFLFALVSKRDVHHQRALDVFREFRNRPLRDQLLTTNHVVAETITLTLRVGHAQAAKLGDQLYKEKFARIHWASPDEERTAFEYFKRHQDQNYSMVDCLSFILMESLESTRLWQWIQTSHTGSLRGRVRCVPDPLAFS